MVETHRYESARDLFEAARNAAQENDRTRRMLVAMEEQEGLRGAGTGARVASGSIGDPMSRVDARVDREAAWHRRIEENCELIDLANAVIYGRWYDGEGGVDALLTSAHADVLWWYYLAREPWLRVGEKVGYSEQWCRQMRDEAFDMIDSYGLQQVIDGLGLAERDTKKDWM